MIEVQFPDGSTSMVPSKTRAIPSKEIGGPGTPILIEEPAYDRDWRFTPAIGGKWFAHPRR